MRRSRAVNGDFGAGIHTVPCHSSIIFYYPTQPPTIALHYHCTDCFMMTGLAGVLDYLRPRFSPSHSESGLTLISLVHIPSFHLCEMLWRKHTSLVPSYTRWPESPDENSHDKKLTQIWDKPRLYLGVLFEVSHCTSALHGNPHIPCPPRVEYQMIYLLGWTGWARNVIIWWWHSYISSSHTSFGPSLDFTGSKCWICA